MKATGIVRSLDHLGRVVIPMEIRKTRNWVEHTPMEFFMDGENLVIRKYRKIEENQEIIRQLESAIALTDNPVVEAALQNTIQFIKKG